MIFVFKFVSGLVVVISRGELMISYSFLERGGGAALQFPLSFDTLKSDFLYRNIKAWFSNNSFLIKKTSFKQKY